MDKNLKITVVGAGGIGGFIGGMIAKHFPHTTIVARGKRGEALKKDGLVLHSEYKGDQVIALKEDQVAGIATEIKEVQDVIFVCVKTYSLEEVAKQIEGIVDEHTIVVPVMNGADTAEYLQELLPKAKVLDCVIYIITYANPDYSITQTGDYTIIWLGSEKQEDKEAVTLAADILREAEFEPRVTEDIKRQIWKKYVMNCSYNVCTAAYDNTIGELRNDPVKAKEYEDLTREAFLVAKAKKINLKDSDLDWLIHRFYYDLEDGDTSSLQRDINAHHTAEIETFSGYLVREAKRLGVDVPVSEKMYHQLLDLI